MAGRIRVGGKVYKAKVRKPYFFWDTQTVSATGVTQRTYFQAPKSATKSLRQTNLDVAGKLPTGYHFLLTSPRAVPVTTTTADLSLILSRSVYVLKLNGNPVVELPLEQIPAGGGPSAAAAGEPSFIAALNLDRANAIRIRGSDVIPSTLEIPDELSGLSKDTDVKIVYFGILFSPLTIS